MRRIEVACRKVGVECVGVHGSCTVPPLQVLRRRSGDDTTVLLGYLPRRINGVIKSIGGLKQSGGNSLMSQNIHSVRYKVGFVIMVDTMYTF